MVIIGKEVAPLHIQNTAGEHAHAPPMAARTNVQRGILQVHLPAILDIQVGIIPCCGQQGAYLTVFGVKGTIDIDIPPLHVDAYPVFNIQGLVSGQDYILRQDIAPREQISHGRQCTIPQFTYTQHGIRGGECQSG